MFSINHIIWLIISVIIISGILIINKIFKLSYRTNLIVVFVVAILSEFVKIMVNMQTIVGTTFETSGTYLEYEDLPFHLCSIQLFFITALLFFVKKDSTKNKLLEFMFPTMCVGAALALFIPTEGVSFTNPQVYQYYIFHSYIIGYAINLVVSKNITITFKSMFRNIALLCGLALIAIYVNSILSFANTNFMFLARPPLEGLPILNLNHGWHWYFATVVIIAIVLMVAFHLPFAIKNYRKIKKRS